MVLPRGSFQGDIFNMFSLLYLMTEFIDSTLIGTGNSKNMIFFHRNKCACWLFNVSDLTFLIEMLNESVVGFLLM